MRGKLEGATLEAIPATMVTWRAWRKEHPNTTVINMTRTVDMYVKEYYDRPDEFVLAWVQDGDPHAVGFDVLVKKPVINDSHGRNAVVITFNQESTAANLFFSEVDGQSLHFVTVSPSQMSDSKTESVWNSQTGECIEGPMKGKKLKQLVGIVSYTSRWKSFHPDTRFVRPADE